MLVGTRMLCCRAAHARLALAQVLAYGAEGSKLVKLVDLRRRAPGGQGKVQYTLGRVRLHGPSC